MNYLAHLFFAKNNSHSVTGNLMADFSKGLDISALPERIQLGIKNHRFIDKFTDQHDTVKQLKPLLSIERRRFAFIISDVVFDHFLAIHFHHFSSQTLSEFSQQRYHLLLQSQQYMPEKMQSLVKRMSQDDWLTHYKSIEITGKAIDGISKRIRFNNCLGGAITEVKDNYDLYEQAFWDFFPKLQQVVNKSSIET